MIGLEILFGATTYIYIASIMKMLPLGDMMITAPTSQLNIGKLMLVLFPLILQIPTYLYEGDELNTMGDTFTFTASYYAYYLWEGYDGVFFILNSNNAIYRALESFALLGLASFYF